MTNEVTVFKTPDSLGGKDVRIKLKNGEPIFVVANVCKVVGRSNPRDAVAQLEPDQKGTETFWTPGWPQKLTVCTESGLYLIVMRAQRWGLRSSSRTR